MPEFIPTKGYCNCPKCGGWQVLDFTKRKLNKDPIGALDYRDCDRCLGKGEIADGSRPVVAVEPPKRERRTTSPFPPMPINDIGDWQEKPVEPVNPWANLVVDKVEEPPKGWPSFNKS